MAENLARQLIAEHLIEGEMRPDAEIALKIDQFLLHDGTGPLCALQLEAMGAEQVCAETAVAYVDHLLVEADSKNADDHILLHSAARRFGMVLARRQRHKPSGASAAFRHPRENTARRGFAHASSRRNRHARHRRGRTRDLDGVDRGSHSVFACRKSGAYA